MFFGLIVGFAAGFYYSKKSAQVNALIKEKWAAFNNKVDSTDVE